MIKKIRNVMTAVAMVLALGAPAIVGSTAFAANAIQDNLCNGVSSATSGTTSSAGCTSTSINGTDQITSIARTVIMYLSIIVGVVAVIMIIFGGFRYITSGGDSGKVGSAKNTIIYAIIGLILVALAQIIVNVVLTRTSQVQ